MKSVYCAVRTGPLNIIQLDSSRVKPRYWKEILSSSYPSRPATQPTPPGLQRIPSLFSGVKLPERGTDHLPPSTAKAKKEWTYIYVTVTSPLALLYRING